MYCLYLSFYAHTYFQLRKKPVSHGYGFLGPRAHKSRNGLYKMTEDTNIKEMVRVIFDFGYTTAASSLKTSHIVPKKYLLYVF
jgi:hypothetical protein